MTSSDSDQPLSLGELYASGQQLLRAGQPAAAAAAFERCLTQAAAAQLPLQIAQAADILIAIATSYAQAQRPLLAQANAQRALLTIQQRPGWQDELPAGITLVVPPSYDPSVAAALAGEAAGHAADALNQPDAALHQLRDAAEAWIAADQPQRAAQTLMQIAAVARRHQSWQTLQEAAEQALELSDPANQQALQIAAYQAIAQANAARERLPLMIEALASAVALERISRHPDLAADEQLLREAQQELSRPAPPAPAAAPPSAPAVAAPSRRIPERPVVTSNEREREAVANVLKEFAYALSGNPRVFEEKKGGLLGGLRSGREPKEVWHWKVTNGSGADPAEPGRELPFVTLELPHAPTSLVRVFLAGGQRYRLRLLHGRPLEIVASEDLANDRALRDALDRLFRQGLLVLREKKLYVQL